MSYVPGGAHPDTGVRLTTLQYSVLHALCNDHARLRWHSGMVPANPGLTGRSQVLLSGTDQDQKLMPSSTARALVKHGYVDPIDGGDRRPFAAGGPHRDYTITNLGRRAAEFYRQHLDGAP